ncbi:MAG: sulfatase-like hydrolase/transferase, partial [Thermoanaerobaculia bacterium]|nr:sulfatase-like hydrolase/transferase [Thermoanaerobaculia bacterium]
MRRPTRAAYRRSFAALAAGCALLLACDAGPAGQEGPIYLVERFDESLVEPAPSPIPTPEPTEWDFAEGDERWRVAQGIADARVVDGALAGTSTSREPIVVLQTDRPRGTGDRLHSVVVRARVSAGKTLSVTCLNGEREPAAKLLARKPPGPLALETPLLAGDEMQTYTILDSRNFPLGKPIDRSDVERVLVMPSDQAGATFEIESVRLVFRKEYLATVPSGIGWHGLGEIYHETLVTRSPETVRFRLEMPSRPWLDIAIGTIEETPVRFRVEVAEPGADSGEPVLLRTVTTPERWEPARIELGPWAGREVDLLMAAESASEGAVALWGTAVLRSSRAPGSASGRDAEPGTGPPKGVILFIGDTLRRDHLQPYGYERANAPTLARLAEEGALFEDAIAQGTWTKASVPSIFSSAYPATSGVRDFVDRLPASAVT